MAEGLNKAMLIGNLGADPELRVTQNNRPVLKFRMATTESYVTDSGERREVTHWHHIVLWGKRAEALSKILSKGSRVYVEGRIESRSYDDKDGVKKYITEISASNLLLLDRREGGGAGGSGYSGGGSPGGTGGGRGRAPGGPGVGDARQAPAGGGRDEIPPDDFGGGGTAGGDGTTGGGGGDLGGSDDDIPF